MSIMKKRITKCSKWSSKKYFSTGWNFNRVHTSLGEIKEFEMRSTGQLELETETTLLPTILSRKLATRVQMRVRNRVDSSRFLALLSARRNIITNYSATLWINIIQVENTSLSAIIPCLLSLFVNYEHRNEFWSKAKVNVGYSKIAG